MTERSTLPAAAPGERHGAGSEKGAGGWDGDGAAEPDTLRYRLLSLPARLVRHARARVLKISRTWPWKEAFLACCQRLRALPAPA